MKEIELFINEDGEWINRISLVDEPAIESDFLAFKKERLEFKRDEERYIITGPVMIPEKRMYRDNVNGSECMVYFSRTTIATASQRWLQEGRQASFNLDHSSDVDGVTVVESWLKESDCDKSIALGFSSHPDGTWFISCKVDDESTWNAIKDGEFKGFSIEGMFSFGKDEKCEETQRKAPLTDDELLAEIISIIE